jgi:hypothetical protein
MRMTEKQCTPLGEGNMGLTYREKGRKKTMEREGRSFYGWHRHLVA